MNITFRAISTYFPGERIASAELDKRCGLKEGYIEKNTGVKFRHHAHKTDTVAKTAAQALNKALQTAGLKPSDIDLLLFTGASFDRPIPHNACLIKAQITDDSNPFPCFDIDSTCLSFVNGLDVAHLYIQSGRYNRIALVSAEIPSDCLNIKDPGTYGLFGDAAVAVIIEKGNGYTPLPGMFLTYPSGAELAGIKYGGVEDRALHKDTSDPDFFFKMEGRPMIQLSKKHLNNYIERLEAQSHMPLQKMDYIFPHQSSKYGNMYFMEQYALQEKQVINTLEEYGNCISASIPLGLERILNNKNIDLQHKNMLLIGTAAGFSLGGMVLKF
ncbi:3-oxoacyl-ACP synthase III family protein [Cytophaga aurantiaca]|uniref:3-oxoacyl-ACP synthase III family protein n=1 Tax=Cytophaga aurantiaca TaxID=29530 RepID=UPI000373A030|nr:3-oxoacyl-ACP synthase [Cytophaga aurantiaca]